MMLAEQPVTLHLASTTTDPYPKEQPQYPALSLAVSSRWRLTVREFRALRLRWFAIVQLADPNKPAAVGFTDTMRELLDRAIERFLSLFAGDDRSKAGFSSVRAPERILQDSETVAYHVGAQRGAELVSAPPATLTDRSKAALYASAFDRMSADGKLRFETRLGEIRDAMIAGFDQGENPNAIAAKLGRDLTGFEQGNLNRIVRTEMASAAISGQVDTYAANGVETATVVGDPGTDELCTSHIGRTYPLSASDEFPPYHPFCFCDITPGVS